MILVRSVVGEQWRRYHQGMVSRRNVETERSRRLLSRETRPEQNQNKKKGDKPRRHGHSFYGAPIALGRQQNALEQHYTAI